MIQKIKDLFNSASIFIVVFLLAFSITSQVYLTKQIQTKELLKNNLNALITSYNNLANQYKALQKQSNEYTERLIKLQQLNAEYERKIKELDNNIKNKNTEIELLRKELLQLDDQLAELTAKENQGTYEERISNLKQQRDIWAKKFSLCKEEVAKKDEIIFSLAQKYDFEHALRLEWERKAQEEYGLRVSWQAQAEKALKELEQAKQSLSDAFIVLKREQAKSRWYRLGLYALGGILAFSLAK